MEKQDNTNIYEVSYLLLPSINLEQISTKVLSLKDKLVSIQRVTKVTKGGRNFTFSAIVVVGNEKGIVGYGLGKAKEVTDAITKGIDDAKKNLIKVAIVKGTVPHEQYGKFSGSLVFLKICNTFICWRSSN